MPYLNGKEFKWPGASKQSGRSTGERRFVLCRVEATRLHVLDELGQLSEGRSMCGDVLTDEPLRRHELLIGRPQEMVAILKVVQIKQAADVVTDDTLIT